MVCVDVKTLTHMLNKAQQQSSSLKEILCEAEVKTV
jgi:hypothetical protein